MLYRNGHQFGRSFSYGMFDAAIEAARRRREFVCQAAPHCPICDAYGQKADQVQIMREAPPAKWRCRICKHRWTYEPKP